MEGFIKVLELPKERVKTSRRSWEKLAILTQSLGRRVLLEWIAKEIQTRGKLLYDIESFPLAGDHFIFYFKIEEDHDATLTSGPWVIAS